MKLLKENNMKTFIMELLYYVVMTVMSKLHFVMFAVSPTLNTGVVGTGQTDGIRQVVDMSDPELLEKDSGQLLILLNKITGRRIVHNPKFYWQEDDYVPENSTVKVAVDLSGVASGNLDVISSKPFRVGDLVSIPNISNVLRKVTAIVDADTITIASLDGTNMDNYTTVGDYVQILGNWNEEGSGKRTILSTQPDTPFNMTQIIKSDTGQTGTQSQTKVYGPEELARNRKKLKVEHDKKIQRAMLFNEASGTVLPYNDTTGTHPKRAMKGIADFITTKVTNNLGAPLTESSWEDWLEAGFEFGSGTKYVFCSSKVLSYPSAWSRQKIRKVSSDKVGGIEITEYISPHGKVYLINARKIFDKAPWNTWAMMLDLVNIRYTVLGNRDTKLMANIQANDEDQQIDEYITECSVEVKFEETHSMLKNVG
jgi:hypothetical protein